MSTQFSQPDIDKLKRIISEGIQVTQEIETLREGLRDTVKAIAEEINIKPATLNKAIKIAHKAEFGKNLIVLLRSIRLPLTDGKTFWHQ